MFQRGRTLNGLVVAGLSVLGAGFVACSEPPPPAAPPADMSAPAAAAVAPAPQPPPPAMVKKLPTPEELAALKTEADAKPDDIQIQRKYQDALRDLGEKDRLRSEYDARLKANPQSALANYLFGRSIIMESPKEAELAIRQAIQLDPKLTWGYLALGKIQVTANSPFDATKTFEDGLKEVPDSVELWLALAKTRFESKFTAKALEAADKAVALAPENAVAHETRGSVLYAQNDMNGAKAAMEKALSLDPNLPDANLLLAAITLDAGQPDVARNYAIKAQAAGARLSGPLMALLGQQPAADAAPAAAPAGPAAAPEAAPAANPAAAPAPVAPAAAPAEAAPAKP